MLRKFILLVALAATIGHAHAQTIVRKDASIEEMVGQVSSDSLRSYINQLVKFQTRHTLSNTSDKGNEIGAARNWVVQQFNAFARSAGGRMTAFVDTVTIPADGKRVDKPTNLGNAMAILKGTDPTDTRVYIISGHLDSRVTDVMNRTSKAPGANDDGSGVAAVLECARVMSRHAFPATVIFVAVSGEEQSLLGSTYLAQKAKREHWNIDAMLNNDIMGSNNSSGTNIIDNTRLRVFSETYAISDTGRQFQAIRSYGLENDSKSRQLARYVKEIGERYVPNLEVVMIYRSDRYLRGGDHTPFLNQGFTAVRLTEMNENFDHQHQDLRTENGHVYGDLPEFMDFEYLRKNTAVNLATLANLTSAPSQPLKVSIEVAGLSNSSSIKWEKPLFGSVAGYYVLVRETTAAQWQKKIYTTGTALELPYSKDNYFFAVQAVDVAGHESLPVIPMPAR